MTQETTFNLAKGLYHVQNAIVYFEHIKSQPEVRTDRKYFLTHETNKLRSVVSAFTAQLPPESARILREEMESDTMVFEAIKNKLVSMCQADRWKVEEYIDKLLNQNQIKNA